MPTAKTQKTSTTKRVLVPKDAAAAPAATPTEAASTKVLPAARTGVKKTKGIVAPSAAKAVPQKEKREKLVRDSFTFPKADFILIEQTKQRAIKLGLAAKKSQVLRAALRLIAALDDAALKSALAAVPALPTGRPKKKN